MTELIRCESLQGFTQLVAELGGELSDVLTYCDIAPRALAVTNRFIPYRDYIVLLEGASAVLQCPDFGIRLAAKQTIDILGPLALAAKQATTLEEALSWVIQYIHFHAQGLEVRLAKVPHSDRALLTVAIVLTPSPKATQTIELTVALGCQFINFLSNGQCHIDAVHLPHHFTQMSWHAKNAFRSTVVGDQAIASILLNQDDLKMPVHCQRNSLADAAKAFLVNHCDTQSMSLTNQVSVLIKSMLMLQLCRNDVIASALDLSVRQLHRKLANEGTSFSKVKNNIRRELAQYYLRQEQLSLSRIAELLDYQEQSAFTKACHGWFGCSARQARYNLQGH